MKNNVFQATIENNRIKWRFLSAKYRLQTRIESNELKYSKLVLQDEA